tara:strand:+ start:105 stop:1391 length:1287 start_codon:yes stop_codon:yes gene_type:complete
MTLALKRSHLVAAAIVGSVMGYPIASLFSQVTGIENQIAAIAMRGAILACAVTILIGSLRISSRLAVALFTLFWGGYILRLAFTFGLTNEVVSEPASTFFIWGLGVCLMPSVAVLLYKGHLDFAKMRLTFAILGAVAMVGILLLGGTAIETAEGQTFDQNRWNLATINPITIGHLGASLVLTASAALLYEKSKGRRLLFYGAIAGIGLIGLFLANSRGPLVAMAVAIGTYGLAQIRSKRAWRYSMIVMLGGLVVLYRKTDALFEASGILDRFARLATGEDRSAMTRTELYSDGIAQFLASPFVGDGLEVRSLGFYPHNVILEAFIATGVIGGITFLVLTLMSIRASYRIMKLDSPKAFMALLAMQYIVAGQFSGAIYQAGPMWVLMAGVLAFSANLKKARPLSAKRSKVIMAKHRQLASAHVPVHRGK